MLATLVDIFAVVSVWALILKVAQLEQRVRSLEFDHDLRATAYPRLFDPESRNLN